MTSWKIKSISIVSEWEYNTGILDSIKIVLNYYLMGVLECGMHNQTVRIAIIVWIQDRFGTVWQ